MYQDHYHQEMQAKLDKMGMQEEAKDISQQLMARNMSVINENDCHHRIRELIELKAEHKKKVSFRD